MTPQTRRALLTSALAFAATPTFAAAEKKSIEVGKAFPYLENYWKIAAAERSRFTVAYYLARDGRPAAGLKGTIVAGAARTPFSVGAGGRVATLPTLAQIRAKAMLELDAPATARFNMSMVIEPSARPAAEMDAQALALAVGQAAKGAKKVAGLMGLAMPTLDRVIFKGVSAGTVVHADGRTAALAMQEGSPVFEPGKLRTARTLRFARVPTQMMMGAPD
jgi:hypothetical protein